MGAPVIASYFCRSRQRATRQKIITISDKPVQCLLPPSGKGSEPATISVKLCGQMQPKPYKKLCSTLTLRAPKLTVLNVAKLRTDKSTFLSGSVRAGNRLGRNPRRISAKRVQKMQCKRTWLVPKTRKQEQEQEQEQQQQQQQQQQEQEQEQEQQQVQQVPKNIRNMYTFTNDFFWCRKKGIELKSSNNCEPRTKTKG